MSLDNSDHIQEKEKENKKKQRNHFMQINPHINIINNDIEELHQSIYDNKKKCFMLKGAIQTSMNLVKEQSNQLIKDFIKKLTDLRDLYTNEATGYGLIYENIKNDINGLKEDENSLKNSVQICEYRVNRCENDIGYHLLGNKSNSNLLEGEGKKEETK